MIIIAKHTQKSNALTANGSFLCLMHYNAIITKIISSSVKNAMKYPHSRVILNDT